MKRHMTLAVVAMLSILTVACASSEPMHQKGSPSPRGEGIDQKPMYGGMDRQSVPELKATDDKLIADVTNEFGSRQRASQAFVDQGIRYYQVDDYSTAMKRFNQAWLIQPDNPEAFWGFAMIYHDEANYCKARSMVERALNLGLSNPIGLADAGRIYTLCATKGGSMDKVTSNAYLDESEQLYQRAASIAPGNDYIYGSWATAYYWRGNYEEAWRMVHKQRQLGGTPGGRFINLLRSQMPEPN